MNRFKLLNDGYYKIDINYLSLPLKYFPKLSIMKQFLTILFVAFLLMGSLSMQSCKKCTTCKYTYTGPQGQTSTYEYPEVCGNRDDINTIEDICADESAAVAGDCFCD